MSNGTDNFLVMPPYPSKEERDRMTTNTTSTASQAPEVLTKQVSAWRAEVTRLNDLIAHATGASQAPAVSIDSEKFRNLLIAGRFYGDDPTHYTGEKDALVAYIDAKLAQERAMTSKFQSLCESQLALVDVAQRRAESAETRATAAEAKLEAIRQGVEGLIGRPDNWIKRDEVLALLQPQPQADREAEQRKRIQERFANRPKTPATADFDLPYASNSDGPDYSKADESGLPG